MSLVLIGNRLVQEFIALYGTDIDNEGVFLTIAGGESLLCFREPGPESITEYLTYVKYIQKFLNPRTRLKLKLLKRRYKAGRYREEPKEHLPNTRLFNHPKEPEEGIYCFSNTVITEEEYLPGTEKLEALSPLFTDFDPTSKTPQQFFWYWIFPDFKPDLISFTRIIIMISDELRKQVVDKYTLSVYLEEDPFGNFINMRDPIHIESPEFNTWLNFLTDGDDPNVMRMGVQLINRVMAISQLSRVQIAVKSSTDRNGIVIKFYSFDDVRKIFKKYNYQFTKEEDQEGERAKKRSRRECNWFKYWEKNQYRAETNDIIFRPWSLNRPYEDEIKEFFSNRFSTFRPINEFHGWPVTKDECRECYNNPGFRNGVDFFVEMIRNRLCNGDASSAEYLLNWIAFIVQKPAEKTKVAIVVRGQEGIGKSWILQIFQSWFRNHYYYLGGGDPSTKFNGFMQHRKMIGIDEVHKLIENIDAMKALITETTVTIETKGVDQRNDINLAEFFGTTNNTLKLPLSRESRRWVIIEANEMNHKELTEWKKTMVQQYNNFFDPQNGIPKARGPVWALLYFFLSRDISTFVPFLDLPQTSAVLRNIENSLPPIHTWWKYVLETRQIKTEMVPNTPLENFNYSAHNLLEAFKLSDHWQDMTGVQNAKRIKMTKDQFMLELSKLISYTSMSNNQIKLKSWAEQEIKWSEFYPNIKIKHEFRDIEFLGQYEKDKIYQIEKLPQNPQIPYWAPSEINYIIHTLSEKLKRYEPDLKIEFYSSLYSQRPVNDKNKDVIEFS